jgi:hypothetical protein
MPQYDNSIYTSIYLNKKDLQLLCRKSSNILYHKELAITLKTQNKLQSLIYLSYLLFRVLIK